MFGLVDHWHLERFDGGLEKRGNLISIRILVNDVKGYTNKKGKANKHETRKHFLIRLQVLLYDTVNACLVLFGLVLVHTGNEWACHCTAITQAVNVCLTVC